MGKLGCSLFLILPPPSVVLAILSPDRRAQLSSARLCQTVCLSACLISSLVSSQVCVGCHNHVNNEWFEVIMKCHVKGGGLPVACFFLIFGLWKVVGLQVVINLESESKSVHIICATLVYN
jgi:hypothetical protein